MNVSYFLFCARIALLASAHALCKSWLIPFRALEIYAMMYIAQA